jgi:hypothetical protein
MKETLFALGKIIGVLVFIAVFSVTGLVSGQPLMILAYAGFITLIMFFIFLFVRRNQRHFEFISQRSRVISKIIGIIMILVALAVPVLAISNMQLFDLGTLKLSTSLLAVVVAITIGLVAGGLFAVYLINRAGSGLIHKIIGYLLIIGLSAVPALLVIPHDRTTTGIGSVYYIVIILAVISWWGFSLLLNKE